MAEDNTPARRRPADDNPPASDLIGDCDPECGGKLIYHRNDAKGRRVGRCAKCRAQYAEGFLPAQQAEKRAALISRGYLR